MSDHDRRMAEIVEEYIESRPDETDDARTAGRLGRNIARQLLERAQTAEVEVERLRATLARVEAEVNRQEFWPWRDAYGVVDTAQGRNRAAAAVRAAMETPDE